MRGVLLLILISFFARPAQAIEANQIDLIIELARTKNLHNSHIWKSLLHTKNGKLNITDPNFILSIDNFSLENELIKTIKSFFESPTDPNKHPICKFPARFFWIKKELNLDDSVFPRVRCEEFEEYLNRAPAQTIYLVFASENIFQPSSMMGHVFLKLSGIDFKSRYVEHAVSFYTVIDTFNIPWLIVKSTLLGMNGFFSLLPYEEQINRYLEVENRSIWEYELNLTEEDRLLMYYHIWELKDLKIKYLFTGYNCATLIHNILALASQDLSKSNRLWITPKDVIKDAYQNNLIKSIKIIASDEWKIRMLSDALDSSSINYIYNLFKKRNFNSIDLSKDLSTMIYQLELIDVYSKYLYKLSKINEQEFILVKQAVEKIKRDSFSDNMYYIDLSHYKSPIKTFDDSQIGFGYRFEKQHNFLKLYFLPASHTLSDDNREYFSESSLKLGEITLLINDKGVKLDSLQLYAVRALNPWNKFVKGISREFKVGFERHYDKKLRDNIAMNISGGVGITKNIFRDVNTFLIFGGGIAYGKKNLYFYLYPEFGMIVYEILNMKTIFSYKNVYNQLEPNNFYHDFDITHSIFIDKRIKINVAVKYLYNNKYSRNAYEVGLNVYF